MRANLLAIIIIRGPCSNDYVTASFRLFSSQVRSHYEVPKLISVRPSIVSMVAIRRWRLLGTSAAALAGLYHLLLAGYLFTTPDFTKTTYGQDAMLEVPGFFLLLGAFQLVWAWITLKENRK